jgi:dTDP-4-amino-4,6-dideoxygalactose transaminase
MDAVLTAMVEEKIGPGERSRLLVQIAKEHLGFDYALVLRSPAVALHLALKALDIKPGKAVIISALSPRYYLQVLSDLQLHPLFCDVTYDFPCLSKELIENSIARKPAEMEVCAIVLHHTLGFVPDTAAITELGIPVIEDISQSCTSLCKNNSGNEEKDKTNKDNSSAQKIFGTGQFVILGLEERDMLTSGGGALLYAMNRKDASMLRNFSGIANEYCLPDINAALAIVQFKEMHRNIERRRDIAEVFIQASLRTRHKRFIPVNDADYCNYSFSLILETGLKDVIAYAKKKEIEIENAFENTVSGLGLCSDCPVSSSLVLRTVLFPMYPRLRSQDIERISRLIMTLP